MGTSRAIPGHGGAGQSRGVAVDPTFGRLVRDLDPGSHSGRTRSGRVTDRIPVGPVSGLLPGLVHGSVVRSLATGGPLFRLGASGGIPHIVPSILARGLILGRTHVSFDARGVISGSASGGPLFRLRASRSAGQVLLVGERGYVPGHGDGGEALGLVVGRGSVLPVIGLICGRLVFVLADGRLVLSLAAGRLVAVLPEREAKSQAHVPYSRTRR